MLRMIIGKPKNSKQKQKAHDLVLPKSLWKFYFKYAFPGSWKTLAAWVLLYVIATADDVVFPNAQRWFVQIFESDIPNGMTLLQYALPIILVIVGLFLLLDAARLGRAALYGRWSAVIQKRISTVLTDYVHNQSMVFWTGRMSGQVYSQIGYIASGVFVIDSLLYIAAVFSMMLINVGMVLSINKYIAMIFGVVFVLRIIYSWIMIKPMSRAAKASSSANSEESGKTVDSISNFSVVKLFAGTKRERNYLEPVRNKYVKAYIHTAFVERMLWGVPVIFWDICYGLILLLCVWMYMRGQITIAEIVYTNAVFMTVMGSINSIINSIPTVTETLGSASKAYSELVVPNDVTDVPNAKDIKISHGKIEIKNLSFKYKRKWVLRDFNLTIKSGERVGLVGPSGAGKTTLVNLLMRLYNPCHGNISIDGQDISLVTQNSLRENIAFIPQEPTMFNRTLAENIAYGKPDATISEIRNASKRAAAHDFIMATDKKYDSLVGDRGD